MSEKRQKIIKNFCKRFLEIDHEPESFSQILDMEPSVLKGCSNEQYEKLKASKITKIRKLIKIPYEKIESKAKEIGVDAVDLRKWVMASQLVSRAWRKRSLYLDKNSMKIAVLGLDNAGKTTLLESLSGKGEIGEIVNCEPTIGIDVKKINSENFDMVIWDFGGQIGHRHDYLKNPEEYFLQIDLFIFVIDMQDDERYDEAIKYYKDVIDILKFLNENPYNLVFLHKTDPDICTDPEFLINLEYIRDVYSTILSEKNYNYEIVETSIFNMFSNQPKFAHTFKEFFANPKDTKTAEDYFNEISKTLIHLGGTIMERFNELEQNILSSDGLKPPIKKENLNKQLLDLEFKNSLKTSLIPPPPPPSSSNSAIDKLPNLKNSRNNLMSELKTLFRVRNLIN